MLPGFVGRCPTEGRSFRKEPEGSLGNGDSMRFLLLLGLAGGSAIAPAGLMAVPPQSAVQPYRDWRIYGGDRGGTKYSALDQINRQNVRRLRPAWIYHCGDASAQTRIECN